MIIIIQSQKNPRSQDLIKCPDDVSAIQVVEKWQRKSIYYQVHKKLPSITWKVAESSNIVDAMIEGSLWSRGYENGS